MRCKNILGYLDGPLVASETGCLTVRLVDRILALCGVWLLHSLLEVIGLGCRGVAGGLSTDRSAAQTVAGLLVELVARSLVSLLAWLLEQRFGGCWIRLILCIVNTILYTNYVKC